MRFVILALALAGCTVGAVARAEASLDLGGGVTYRAGIEPGAGITKLDEQTEVAGRDEVVALITLGGGWGSDGVFFTTAVQAVTVPPPGGGFGYAGGVRFRFDRRCLRWSIGFGASALVAQLRAEDRSDQFGPNPRVTRAYHDATAFAGYAICDNDTSIRPMLGAAYELGIAALLFAPGP